MAETLKLKSVFLACVQLLKLAPSLPMETCKCGQHYSEEGLRLIHSSCNVYLPAPHTAKALPLYELNCPERNPDCKVVYDGLQDGLFCHSKNTFISLWMLYKYTDNYVSIGRSQESFVEEMAKDYRTINVYRREDTIPFISPNTFRAAWFSFLSVLQLEFHFRCPLFKDSPKELICDGTMLTIPKHLYFGQSITEVDPVLPTVPKVGQNRASRCFCCAGHHDTGTKQREECMRLLVKLGKKMLQSCIPEADRTSPTINFSEQDATSLQDFLAPYRVGPLVQRFYTSYSLIDRPLRGLVGRLLKCLGSPSPVSSYFPAAMVDHLRPVLESQSREVSPLVMSELENHAPLVAAGMRAVWDLSQSDTQQLDDSLVLFLDVLVTRAKSCLAVGSVSGLSLLSQPKPPSCMTRECLETGICTGLAQVRNRGQYEADKEKKKRKRNDWECNHACNGGRSKTGGIFSWFCRHGVCYGFYIIPDAEGRNEAFSFLIKHFETPPEVVIYDFACSLQEYCLNREPEFFKNTKFVFDAFHWPNHNSCAESYDIRVYKKLVRLNSEAAEQCHAGLASAKGSASRMGQRSFMLSMRLFFENWNGKKIEFVSKCKDGLDKL